MAGVDDVTNNFAVMAISSPSDAVRLCLDEMVKLRTNLRSILGPTIFLADGETLVTPISFKVWNKYCKKWEQVAVYSIKNPWNYAWDFHEKYIRRTHGRKKILFVGMNPSRSRKSLSGIPFYEEDAMSELLGANELNVIIDALPDECKADLSCNSALLFHPYVRKKFITTANFFKHCCVINYCPLIFLNQAGYNVSLQYFNNSGNPILETLMQKCDDALEKIIDILQPRLVVGIGRYAQGRIPERHNAIYMYHPARYEANATDDWYDHLQEGLELEQAWIDIVQEILDEEFPNLNVY